MKKILALSVILAFSTNLTLAATSYTSALKDAVKKDIEAQKAEAKNYKQSVKDAIQKDINANSSAIKARKTEKTKEIEAKIQELKEEKAALLKRTSISHAEKAKEIQAIDKQIENYLLQLVAQ